MRFKDLKRAGRDHWERLLAHPRATRAGRWDWRKARVATRMPEGHYMEGYNIKLDLLAAAAHAGNVDLVELLVRWGARAFAWRAYIQIHLAWARVVQLDPKSATRLRAALIEAGASPFAPDMVYPYMSAFTRISQNTNDVGRMLPHPDVNRQNAFHHTALHFAARANRHHVVARLCAAGADPNRINEHDRTPLDVAIKSGAKEAARSLIRFGGHGNAGLSSARSPLISSMPATRPNGDTPLKLVAVPWSASTHADVDVGTRGVVVALFLCAQRVSLPAEMARHICAHFTCLAVTGTARVWV